MNRAVGAHKNGSGIVKKESFGGRKVAPEALTLLCVNGLALDQLEQNAARGCRVEEHVRVAARAGPRLI